MVKCGCGPIRGGIVPGKWKICVSHLHSDYDANVKLLTECCHGVILKECNPKEKTLTGASQPNCGLPMYLVDHSSKLRRKSARGLEYREASF